jgi:hypothetical protein
MPLLPSPTALASIGAALLVLAGLVVWLLKDIKLAAYIGVAAGACFLAATVAHTYKAQGDAAARAELTPKIVEAQTRADTSAKVATMAQADLAAMRAAYAVQDKAVADQSAAAATARAAADAAIAKASADAKRYQATISTLRTLAATPTKGDACAQADSVLRALAADSVRQ